MATDAGGSRPLTALVAGNGQSAVSYTLPAGLYQYVQSVVATINTSASGDVTPLLTVTDDAGIVVADKQQGQTMDAGGSGRATWALRLTDETGATSGDIGVAHALFSAAAIEAGATKILVPARPNVIVIPLDFMVAASPGLTYSTSAPFSNPQVILETPSWGFNFYDVPTFGDTRFSTFEVLIGDNTFNNPPLSNAGEPLQARIDPQNLDPGLVGHLDVWAAWHRVKVTP